ncbi:hydrogenase expression/formation protein HypE [Pseudonocardia kunmingensis]|uniref:Hydrogenase maturation carbamoyl dehydratase HypE n=1 Tax=Pseudonocardia kunmingensis TaxID=630975 RepID=A0A543DP75_9PSEU|nr:hydrogenase expression/formation protein HypE [Pseudonocardia kunmingensis]TQM11108.1 hydrogenase maturation carbamoyl dehydratase HypE [Pseudonocardia kunmingensis]
MTRSEVQVQQGIERARRARPRLKDQHITMAHGAGGKATATLVEALFVPAFDNHVLERLTDAAVMPGGIALTTDAYVVSPLRFPGGSIGSLAVHGTVNDLAVSGARALGLSAAFVLEEGLPIEVLRAEVEAAGAAARDAGVAIVTGDTKVVERGKADGLYIVTSGVGRVELPGLDPASLRPGDRVLCSGYVGDHGTAIMLARDDMGLEADVASDTRPLWPVAAALGAAAGSGLRVMRDATRGGVATVLNELAMASDVGVVIAESAVPVRPVVHGACELLGLDPLYVANEGVLIAVIAADVADAALAAVRGAPGGEDAELIGEVAADPPGMVLVRTGIGGHRILDTLIGDPLPRIC